jgi:hypothetical protein
MKKLMVTVVVLVGIFGAIGWFVSMRRITYCKRCNVEISGGEETYWGAKGEMLERSRFCNEEDGHIPTRKEEESASMTDWRRLVNHTEMGSGRDVK